METDTDNVNNDDTTSISQAVCRLCLKNVNNILFPLFEIDYKIDDLSLVDCLELITSVKIARKYGDADLVCSDCIFMIGQSYRFIQQIIKNEAAIETEPIDAGINENTIITIENAQASVEEDELNNEVVLDNTLFVLIENNELQNKAKPTCKYCGKTFLTQRYKANHEKRHTRKGHYRCEVCDRDFYTKADLDRHKTMHTLEKPFQCTYVNCEKSYKTNSELKRHTMFHTGEKKFECNICGKGFNDSSHRRNHIDVVHLQKRNFHCEHCNVSFSSDYQLIRHNNSKKCNNKKEEQNIVSKEMREEILEEDSAVINPASNDLILGNILNDNVFPSDSIVEQPMHDVFAEKFVDSNSADCLPLLSDIPSSFDHEFISTSGQLEDSFINSDVTNLLNEMKYDYLNRILSIDNNAEIENFPY